MSIQEFAIQLVISRDLRGEDALRQAAENIGADMEQATNDIGLPIPAWEISIVSGKKQNAERRLATLLQELVLDPGALTRVAYA